METHQGEDRTERAGRNQTLFREVNERLQGLAETFQHVTETSSFACECADLRCTAMINLRLSEYEAVRSHPNQFAVLPGHVYPDVEDVVAEHDRYVIVSKLGVGAEIAEKTYPRA
ncbi:MAG TPA: hypothetical protein VKA24_04605 [Gaiellaceae bacterium]|nr:hypothetical protein [Gaiellaceae bacterium]